MPEPTPEKDMFDFVKEEAENKRPSLYTARRFAEECDCLICRNCLDSIQLHRNAFARGHRCANVQGWVYWNEELREIVDNPFMGHVLDFHFWLDVTFGELAAQERRDQEIQDTHNSVRPGL